MLRANKRTAKVLNVELKVVSRGSSAFSVAGMGIGDITLATLMARIRCEGTFKPTCWYVCFLI